MQVSLTRDEASIIFDMCLTCANASNFAKAPTAQRLIEKIKMKMHKHLL